MRRAWWTPRCPACGKPGRATPHTPPLYRVEHGMAPVYDLPVRPARNERPGGSTGKAARGMRQLVGAVSVECITAIRPPEQKQPH